jgi:MFS transporter, DHA1 family, multidrug resistance protein
MKKNINPVFSICFIIFVLTIGTGVVAPLLAPYSKDLGATGLWIGIIYSGFYMVRFIIGTPIGRLSDRYGPKGILTISITMYPLIALAYFLSDSLLTLLGARLLHGIASAMLLPMAMTYIGEVTPNGKEGRTMGIYNTVLFLANGVGPILGGLIADWWGVKEAFLLLLILALVTLVLTITTLKSTRERFIVSKTDKDEKEMHEASFWKNGSVIALSSVYFITAVVTMFIVSFFPVYGTEIGFSIVQIGVLIAIYNIVVGVLQIPFGKLADKYGKTKMLLISTFSIGVLFFIIPTVGTFPIMSMLVFIFSICTAVVIASSSAIATEFGRQFSMGKTMGFLSSATSLGMVLGPLFSGLIIDIAPTSWLFFSIGGGWLVSALLLKFTNSHMKQRWMVTKGERELSNNRT